MYADLSVGETFQFGNVGGKAKAKNERNHNEEFDQAKFIETLIQ